MYRYLLERIWNYFTVKYRLSHAYAELFDIKKFSRYYYKFGVFCKEIYFYRQKEGGPPRQPTLFSLHGTAFHINIEHSVSC
jgi:hypothetical protein